MAKSSAGLAMRRWETPPIVATDKLVAPKKPLWPWRATHFVEKTIADVAAALEQMLFTEEFAGRAGLLQRLDPRAKVLSILVFLLSVSLATRITTLVGFHVLALVLAGLSGIPLGFFVKRVWFFIPLFAGVVAVPALFSFVTPGREVFLVADLGASPTWGPISLPARLAITAEGLTGFGLLLLRVATSVSLAVLLALTTKWWVLLKALQILRVPQVIILILAMTYRYIYTVLRTVEQTFQARKSRTVGRISGRDSRRWIGASVATLVGKSYAASNEVYLAMLSRGFTGEVRLASAFALRAGDLVWLLVSVALGGALLVVERGLV